MSVLPLIEFKNASLGYGRAPVLAGVSLSIEPGDFLGILGPNGAGKSTLLKTLLGLIPPLRGQFATHGSNYGMPRYGYVPQKEKLDPIYPLSAYEVAAMGTYRKLELLRGLRGRSHRELIRHCLRESGALELSDRPYASLSGGQRQRVLVARALAAEAELLVLDEPLAGLDVATQKSLLRLFNKFKEKRGLTVLMVSHRLQAERSLFSHVAWVDGGRVESGPASQMLKHREVTEFFGQEP